MTFEDLMAGPPPTHLPEHPAIAAIEAGAAPLEVAAANPDFSLAWALLAEAALADGAPVTAYAYARTGYHRGLDQLRRAGWKGHGPIPWEHEPNRGFLRALHALGVAAATIREDAEAERCQEFLGDASPTAVSILSGGQLEA
jgi:hypothetical protein